MYLKKLVLLFVVTLFFSCQEQPDQKKAASSAPVKFENKAHELVYNMTQKVGDYQQLLEKKDVVYTYTYTTPDGKTDESTEKYIFDGELSYGFYHQHERTFPELPGVIEQGYDGKEFWCKNDNKILTDEKIMKRVVFNRGTNYYWFAMFQKLSDPGLRYEYIRQDTVDENIYDIVKVSFDSENGKPTDIYQVYINQKTSLVDQFLFTVVDFNVVETPFLMKVEYEEVDGILIPANRKYTKANWEGENLDENWIMVRWSNIEFNNDLSKDVFTL